MKRLTFFLFGMMMVPLWNLPVLTMAAEKPSSLKVAVATIYPLAAILQEVAADRLTIKTLLAPASSPHTFEPRPSEIRAIEKAAALFYAGPHLDEEWVGKMPAARKIKMLELLPDNFKLPMQKGRHSDSERVLSHDHNNHQSTSIDPHFWTDPLAVKALLPSLVRELIKIDPAGGNYYEQNSRRIAARLDRLHEKTKQILDPVRDRPILLLHPSFQYLIHRYGLFFAGVIEFSPGKEPTPRFIMKTVKVINRLKVKTLFSEAQLSQKSVSVIAEAAGTAIMELDPIGGVPGRKQYYELILYNADILAKGLR